MRQHVFIDDSGDGGLKLKSGSSRFLVMAGCVFNSQEDMDRVSSAIGGLRQDMGKPAWWEFKHSGSSKEIRRKFFSAVADCSFSVRAIVVDKAALHSDFLKSNPQPLKNYAICQLLTHTFETIKDAAVFIDGKDARDFEIRNSSYLRKEVNQQCPGTIAKVKFLDSKANTLIQLADMVAGCVNRQYDRHDCEDNFAIVKRKARRDVGGSIWKFS